VIICREDQAGAFRVWLLRAPVVECSQLRVVFHTAMSSQVTCKRTLVPARERAGSEERDRVPVSVAVTGPEWSAVAHHAKPIRRTSSEARCSSS
jgi:hypothetical protein